MGKVLNKLKSNNGATLMLALLFFIVCAVTGSMILTAAGVSAGRLENMKRRDQNYFAVRSAIKMCEQQMKEMNIAFTDQLVVTEVEVDSDDDDDDEDESSESDSSGSSPKEGLDYTIMVNQFAKEESNQIRKWIKEDLVNAAVSNYQEKVKAPNNKRDAFDLKWFKDKVENETTHTKEPAILTNHHSIKFSDELEGLNVEIDVELSSLGVLTYKVYNSDPENRDKYIMTLTVDIDVPCKSTEDVVVDVEETGEGENKKTKTITTTTYTNEYTFDFRIRDIKKG